MSFPQTYFNADTLYYSTDDLETGDKNITSTGNINISPSGLPNFGLEITSTSYANPGASQPNAPATINYTTIYPLQRVQPSVAFLQAPIMAPFKTINFTGSSSAEVGPSWLGYNIWVTNPDGGSSTIQINSYANLSPPDTAYLPGSVLRFIFDKSTPSTVSKISILSGATVLLSDFNPANTGVEAYYVELFTIDGLNWVITANNIPSL